MLSLLRTLVLFFAVVYSQQRPLSERGQSGLAMNSNRDKTTRIENQYPFTRVIEVPTLNLLCQNSLTMKDKC